VKKENLEICDQGRIGTLEGGRRNGDQTELRRRERPWQQAIKLKGYYPYFGVQPFTCPSKYFATLQKGSGNFL
jgi:hypothetical protein